MDELKFPSAEKINELVLNKSEVKLLKFINRKREVTVSQAKRRLWKYENKSAVVTLRYKQLISEIPDKRLRIIKRGENWLEYHRRESFRYWYPQFISTVSLIASIIAITLSAIALVKK